MSGGPQCGLVDPPQHEQEHRARGGKSGGVRRLLPGTWEQSRDWACLRGRAPGIPATLPTYITSPVCLPGLTDTRSPTYTLWKLMVPSMGSPPPPGSPRGGGLLRGGPGALGGRAGEVPALSRRASWEGPALALSGSPTLTCCIFASTAADSTPTHVCSER